MMTMGMDPSLTNFGWAIYGTKPLVGGRFQTSNKTLFVDRYTDLRGMVRSLIQIHDVRRVGVEYPIFGEQYSPGLYGLFLYTCEALKAEKCDVVFFSPGQGKAHARDVLKRPKGWKMGKPDMVEAAKLDAGIVGNLNHNIADAYWIARTAARFWAFHDGDITKADLNPLELRQFSEVKTYLRGRKAGEVEAKGILYREDERFFRWSEETTNGKETTEEP